MTRMSGAARAAADSRRARSAAALAGGQVIAGRYRLVDRLGRRRSASVWLGWDLLLGRPLALKPVTETGIADALSARERALREARITVRLQHANVVPVFDVVEQDDITWAVMPFVPSRSLQRVIEDADDDPLDESRLARIGADVAVALAATHALDFAHGSVGPETILVTEEGTARLFAFGASGSHVHRRHGISVVQAEDVAGLGRALRSALDAGTGRRSAVADRQPGVLDRLVERMTDPDPLRRPVAAAVADRLAALASEHRDGATVANTAQLTLPPRDRQATPDAITRISSRQQFDGRPAPSTPAIQPRRARWPLVAGALLAAALAGVVAFAVVHSRSSGQDTTAGHPAVGARSLATMPSALARSSSAGAPSVPGQASDEQLVRAVAGYYRLLPRHVTDAWHLLTGSYRNIQAGGLRHYAAFWSSVRSVTATDVVGWAGSNAEATIVVHFDDGRVVREDTVFTLVRRHGLLKIDGSRVQSSTTRGG